MLYNQKLTEWFNNNHINFRFEDDEVVEIIGFGRAFITNTDKINSIFRKINDETVEFNMTEIKEELINEGILYSIFQFGDNWYYTDLSKPFKMNVLKHVGEHTFDTSFPEYVNLGIHTPYELLNGSCSLSEWIKKAKWLGMNHIGVCDKNTMGATFPLQEECAKQGVKHIFGYTLDVTHNMQLIGECKVYVQSQQGLQNLLRIQKEVMVDSEEHTIDIFNLSNYGKGNVLVFGKLTSYWLSEHKDVVDDISSSFEDIMYQFDLTEYKSNKYDLKSLEATRHFFYNFVDKETSYSTIPLVLIPDNYYTDQDYAKNKVILNKIAGIAPHDQSSEQYFKSSEELYKDLNHILTSDWNKPLLFKQMCDMTLKIANNATGAFETGKMFMPEYKLLPEEQEKWGDKRSMFHGLLEEGLEKLIPKEDHEVYRKRMQDELYIIESTNNLDYFLMQRDMTNEARRRGIAVGIGRGSAGGCLISYLLGIISINPLKYDLIFSRFLVPERCGLEWSDVTCIVPDITIEESGEYIELETESGTMKFDIDSQFKVKRGEEIVVVYADELDANDEIIFDNKDILWSLPELISKTK